MKKYALLPLLMANMMLATGSTEKISQIKESEDIIEVLQRMIMLKRNILKLEQKRQGYLEYFVSTKAAALGKYPSNVKWQNYTQEAQEQIAEKLKGSFEQGGMVLKGEGGKEKIVGFIPQFKKSINDFIAKYGADNKVIKQALQTAFKNDVDYLTLIKNNVTEDELEQAAQAVSNYYSQRAKKKLAEWWKGNKEETAEENEEEKTEELEELEENDDEEEEEI